MSRSVLLILFSLLAASAFAHRRTFGLNTSIRMVHPLKCRGVRMLPSAYDAPEVDWVLVQRKVYAPSELPLSAQLSELLNANCCASCPGDSISIALQDVKLFIEQRRTSAFVHAEFFTGPAGMLRHYYTLDTFVTESNSNSFFIEKIASECLLDALVPALRAERNAEGQVYTDREAANFYAKLLSSYPLYTARLPVPLGIFRTPDDLVHLRMVDTPLLFEHIPQATGDGLNRFYYKTADGTKGALVDPDSYFAASDGKNLFYSGRSGFRRIRKSDGEFFVEFATGPFDLETLRKFSPQRKAFILYGGKLPR